jgi:hypothetical protein
VHGHFDETLIAAYRTAAEEIGGHMTAAKTETPDRVIAAHFQLPSTDAPSLGLDRAIGE